MRFFLTMLGASSLLAASIWPALAEPVIKFGTSLQLTGPSANSGRYYRDAYQLVIDRINETGGIKLGGKSHRLQLDTLDNQSDVNLSVRQYVQLITSNEVNFLLGPFASNFALNDSSIAEKYHVPMVQGGGASGEIYSRGYRYVFGTLPAADDYYASTIRMLQAVEPAPKTVALVAADDSGNVSIARGTRRHLKEAGMKLMVDRSFRDGAGAFTSILSEVKAAKVDAILWSGHETDGLNFMRQMKSLDVNPAMSYSLAVGVPTSDFRKALGVDANYAYGMTTWLPDASLKDRWFGDAARFAKIYEDRFGYHPDYHSAAAAAAVETFVYAIETAGSLDPKVVRDAIARSSFDSLYAHVKFGASGQIELPQIVVQIQNGRIVPIFTDRMVNKPLYPIPAWGKRG